MIPALSPTFSAPRPAAPAAAPAAVVRDLYQGGDGGLEPKAARGMRRVLESLCRVTGDGQDAMDDAAFVMAQTSAGEKVEDVGKAFRRLLIAGDGLRSGSVRDLFTEVRGARDRDQALDRAVLLSEACGHDASRAIGHYRAAAGLDGKTLEAYARVLRCSTAAADQRLQQAVHDWTQTGTGATEVGRLASLARASMDAGAALADLDLARSMTDADAAVKSIVTLRGQGVTDPAQLRAGVEASMGGHPATFLALLEVESDARAASEASGWIIAQTPPGQSEKVALDRYIALRQRVPATRRAAVKTLFEQLQARVQAEPQGLAGRLLGLTHPAEKAFVSLLDLDADPDRTLRHIQAVDGGRQPDETLSDALSRYQRLLFMDELDDPDAAQAAFGLVSRALPHGDPGAKARLQRFQDMAMRMGSVRKASEAWKTVADAATVQEFTAREQLLHALLDREPNRSDAAALFTAAAEGLASTDSMTSAMTLLEEYRRKMGPTLAPQAYRSVMSWRSLPGNPCKTLEEQIRFFGDLYAQEPSAQGFAEIDQRLRRPVGNETLFTRATVLRGLMMNLKSRTEALREYDWMTTRLGPVAGEPFESLAEAYAVMAGTAKLGPNADPHAVLEWLLEQKKTNPFFQDAKVAQMMHDMASILVVSRDLDAARMNFVRRDTPAGTVEKGEQEVVIGGIRVPRKKATETGGTPA